MSNIYGDWDQAIAHKRSDHVKVHPSIAATFQLLWLPPRQNVIKSVTKGKLWN